MISPTNDGLWVDSDGVVPTCRCFICNEIGLYGWVPYNGTGIEMCSNCIDTYDVDEVFTIRH